MPFPDSIKTNNTPKRPGIIPAVVEFIDWVVNRDFHGDVKTGMAGDLGPEGLLFIPARESPGERDLLVVANEISGSTMVYEIFEED